jgi:hypothetical protein
MASFMQRGLISTVKTAVQAPPMGVAVQAAAAPPDTYSTEDYVTRTCRTAKPNADGFYELWNCAAVNAAAAAPKIRVPQFSAAIEKIRYQLAVTTGLLGYKYGDDKFHEWCLDALSHALVTIGILDIRELFLLDVSYTCNPSGAVYTGQQYGNRRTNSAIPSQGINNYGRKCFFFNPGFSVVSRAHGPNYSDESGTTCDTTSADAWANNNIVPGKLNTPRPIDDKREFFDCFGKYEGDGTGDLVGCFVRFTGEIPYFIPFRRTDVSDWVSFRDSFEKFAILAFGVAVAVVPGVGPAITAGIFGSLAVAYPVVTALATKVLISTALNGGDVEAAVKGAASGYLGGQVGGVIAGVTDSDAIGKLASTAVSTAARGGDVTRALAMTALQMTPGAVIDFIDSSPVPTVPVIPVADLPITQTPQAPVKPELSNMPYSDSDYFPAQPPVFTDVDYSNYTFDYDSDISWLDDIPIDLVGDPMFDPGILAPNFDGSSVPLTPGVLQPMESWSDGSGVTDTVNTFPNSSPDMTQLSDNTGVPLTPGHFDDEVISDDNSVSFFKDLNFRDVVSGVSDVAVALLRVNAAYQNAGRPSIQPTVTVRPVSNVVETARPNGTIVTTNPANGQTVVTRMPVGVPYVLPSGAVVTNNGDGTFTTIDANGAKISPYAPITSQVGSGGSLFSGSSLIAGVPDYAVVGAGALLLVALMSGRR